MSVLDCITKIFVAKSREILRDNLVGVYLHGSAVMGCFNEEKSDIDILVVVNTTIPNELKRRYMDMVVELNGNVPKKGIEFSIVKEEVCNPFIYPTPFELHFSVLHLQWYKADPNGYIEKMKGMDNDLAAHFTIIYHRGKCLYGKEISDVFEEVDKKLYFDSIKCDIENAPEEISENPTYVILNLCRVLAYKKEELILSKKEGGDWGIKNLPERYHDLILQALDEYTYDKPLKLDDVNAHEYSLYMLEQIGIQRGKYEHTNT